MGNLEKWDGMLISQYRKLFCQIEKNSQFILKRRTHLIHLSVNVFSTKVLIEDPITSPTGPPIYLINLIRATRLSALPTD